MKISSLQQFTLVMLILSLITGCGQSTSPSITASVNLGSDKTSLARTADAPESSTKIAALTESVKPNVQFVNPVSPELAAEGWIALFDGTSLYGWEPQGPAEWKVVDGTIVTDAGDKGFLASYVPYKDYELYYEFKANADTNSGVFIRSAQYPKDPASDCYEVNIASVQPQGFFTGSIVAREKTSQVFQLGDWMKMTIKAVGKQITVKVNDVETLNWTAPDDQFLPEGYINLQRNSGTIAFRNIRVKPIHTEQLDDGKTLKGWHVVPGSKGEFKVSDEHTILVTGGRGFLETDSKYENFVIQFQAKTNAENLNSGLFFRLDEDPAKTLSNGYEYQLHNGKKDGNPLTPLDHGTGGIFKRISARQVVAEDKTWMTCTLVASGPKFQSWVNGYPVVAWTDTRPAHKNPREGLRLEAGPFSLQAHDPTTNVEFRKFELTKLK